MNRNLRNALAVAGGVVATQAAAQVTFYERENFQGRSFTADQPVGNFERYGFNDRASSVVVRRERWEVCEDARYNGRCVVLRPGSYPSLAAMGLDNRVSSVRAISRNVRVDDSRYAPVAVPRYEYYRREGEPLYEARVSSVLAVVGPPEQRCWIEREAVVQERGDASVPGAIVGAVIGGILGHQVGSGRGNDLATAGGAIGGAVVGANIGRDSGGQQVYSRDIRKCATVADHGHVAYWDVTYRFRGQEHHVQMAAPPGATVTVNAQGEPRA
jgi:uncharacterized protein YcfJ